MNDIAITEHLWIPLGDGRRLAARLWLPADGHPAPAILEYLPYRKRDGTAPRDATTHPVFAAHGYASIRVDIAGTGDSDGIFDDEYSEQELSDGEEVIAWIAAQDWCDGNIGMIGISWGGFNGLQLAYRRPPALKAIVTVCSTVDRYADDIHFMGGCLLTDNFNWGGQMNAYQTRPPDPALRDDWRERWLERMETLPFLAAEWLKHGSRDAYWKHGSVCEDWSAINAATLAIGGWADAYVNAPPALAANLAAPAKALVGPWEHKYPHIARINPADFHGEVLHWFDRWLKGEANGAETMPAYRAFMQEHDDPSPGYKPRKGRWIAEAEWPSPQVVGEVLHFSAAGLGPQPGEGRCLVATPQHVGLNAAYFCPGMRVDHELSGDQAEDDALSVCFDSAPLAEPMELLGRPVVEIALAVDRPVAQLCLRLCEVDAAGVSQRVSYRAFNLTHFASHEVPERLEPGKVYTARIALNECAHRFAAGHRLRLALSTSYWPVTWPSPENAGVELDLARCRLVLPRRHAAVEIDPVPPLPPHKFPTWMATPLREPQSSTERRIEADGTHVLETFDDFGAARDAAHGLETGSHVRQRFSIHPDDPLSARHEATWRFEFRRGDWSVVVDTENLMTSTADSFILQRSIIARQGDEKLFEREQTETLPRKFH
ncbi:MAG: CocE/NonD family hydrolase [Rhizobiaceae bacterium]